MHVVADRISQCDQYAQCANATLEHAIDPLATTTQLLRQGVLCQSFGIERLSQGDSGGRYWATAKFGVGTDLALGSDRDILNRLTFNNHGGDECFRHLPKFVVSFRVMHSAQPHHVERSAVIFVMSVDTAFFSTTLTR